MPSKISRQNAIDEGSSTEGESFSVPSSNILDLKRLVQEKKQASLPPKVVQPSFFAKLRLRLQSRPRKTRQIIKKISEPAKARPIVSSVPLPKVPLPSPPLKALNPKEKDKTPAQEPDFFVFTEEKARPSLAERGHLFVQALQKSFQHASRRKKIEKPVPSPEPEPEFEPPIPAPPASLRSNRRRLFPVMGFAVLGLFLILPLFGFANFQKAKRVEEQVLGVSDQALTSLKSAGAFAAAADWDQADTAFDRALDQFGQAEAALLSFDGLLRSVAPLIPTQGKKLQSGEHLLEGGQAIAEAGSYLGQALKPFQEFDLELIKTEDLDQPYGITTVLLLSNAQLRPAEQALGEAVMHFSKVDASIVPEQQREQFILLQEYLPVLQRSVQELVSVSDQLLTFLGHERNRRYLFLFQNDHELRATGGFISSFALLDISQGQITKLEVPGGGTYDLQGWLTEQVLAPEPLRLVNPHWNAQDANWWPDFPTSAEKFIWFYEHSGGPSVDGVIAITPTVVEEFLKQTGPIDMTETYGEKMSAENFRTFAEAQSAAQRDVEGGTPKQFIADFAPKFLNQVFSTRQENLLGMLQTFYGFLREKHILFYLVDEQEQAAFSEFGWTGAMLQAPQDYLSVINTNIAGGPTDGRIDQIITHDATIQNDGSIEVRVEVERLHRGDPDHPEEGVKNMDYMRFYVPEGSVLVSASGFDRPGRGYFLNPEQGYRSDEDYQRIEGSGQIHQPTGVYISSAFGKTVFGHWVQTDAGTSSKVHITYRLPFRVSVGGLWNRSDHYSVLFQKQPGAKASALTSTVHFPASMKASYVQPSDEVAHEEGGTRFHTALDEDRMLGIVLSKD